MLDVSNGVKLPKIAGIKSPPTEMEASSSGMVRIKILLLRKDAINAEEKSFQRRYQTEKNKREKGELMFQLLRPDSRVGIKRISPLVEERPLEVHGRTAGTD